MLRNSKILKAIAVYLTINILIQVVAPTAAFALTSGPKSPEFSSFEPVATTDMVNDFSGDFTYNLPVVNIPGPDNSGYALSLSYHSGVTPEEEASWVGYGWNLNPGALNRSKRGYPDEFKGAPVTQYNKTRPNWTVSAKGMLGLEIKTMSSDRVKDMKDEREAIKKAAKEGKVAMKTVLHADDSPTTEEEEDGDGDEGKEGVSIKLTASKGIRFNNHRGYTAFTSFGASVNGMAGLNMTNDGGTTTFSVNVNPSAILSQAKKKNEKVVDEKRLLIVNWKKMAEKKKTFKLKRSNKSDEAKKSRSPFKITNYNISDFADNSSLPFSISEYKGISYNLDQSLGLNFFTRLGIEIGATGSYNIQFNDMDNMQEAYGYMYAGNASLDGFKDYSVEKGGDINKRDRYLGIPFSGADQFSIMGENLGGGFRLQHGKVGCYSPNEVMSKMLSRPLGLEVGIGWNHVDVGISVGLGKQITKQQKWNLDNAPVVIDANFDGIPEKILPSYDYSYSNSSAFFRFSGDNADELLYSKSTSAQNAMLTGASGNPITNAFASINPNAGVLDALNYTDESTRPKSSSLIGFNTIKADQYDETGAEQIPDGTPDESISEFKVKDKNGNTQVYGLPVYTKEELSLSVFLNAADPQEKPIDNYLVYLNRDLNIPSNGSNNNVLQNDFFTGQYSPTPYSTTHLITQILTPDYIDLDPNGATAGPSDDDFGGWTKFSYKRWQWTNTSNESNDWYHYRIPYSGLSYNEGSINNKKDDVGSMSSGLKQIFYLKTIETKTHVAYFITNKTNATDLISSLNVDAETVRQLSIVLEGSHEIRKDGLGAVRDNYYDRQAKDKTLKDEDQNLEMLEKIVVFSKLDYSKPLQITHFEYDNSLCAGLPNAIYNTKSKINYGKLTLKKVWFESEGVYHNKIAPYKFDYNYPTSYGGDLDTKYPDIKTFLDQHYNSTSQNPNYNPSLLDNWGNFQEEKKGKERNGNLQGWVYQGDNPIFDPAAWNLKRITLPSGGEIQIQYEQKDYQFVQDQKALTLVSLYSDSKDDYGSESVAPKYYLNMSDLGVTKASDITPYVKLIKDYFNDTDGPKNFIYFKFLYALTGEDANLNNLSSEYLSGYATVKNVGQDPDGRLFIEIGNIVNQKRNGKFKGSPKTTPRYICRDYQNTNADGLTENETGEADFGSFNKIEASNKEVYNGFIDGQTCNLSNLVTIAKDVSTGDQPPLLIMGKAATHIGRFTKAKGNVCKAINYPLSYLKIPVLEKKMGGGIRVKRILMYDKGIETGDQSVYGSEYLYELEDGSSSGITPNEPGLAREDHSLVTLLDRTHQSWLNRAISGPDKDENEGPIGESLLPGPSVGYSRIVVRNIHTGESGTGYSINEYYTCKDFPLTYEKTNLSDKGATEKAWLMIPTPYFGFNVKKTFVSQGYAFYVNEMHGKPKRNATYEGDYIRETSSKKMPVASTEYEYFKPGDGIPVVTFDKGDDDIRRFAIENKKVGVEEEVVMESRSMNDETFDISVEIDLAFIWMQLPFSVEFGLKPYVSFNTNQFHSHVINKVFQYPAHVKSVKKTVNGVSTVEENLAFSNLTGDPLITCVSDAYDKLNVKESVDDNYKTSDAQHVGKYYTYNFPAAWFYDEMGRSTTVDDDTRTNQLTAMAGVITTYGLQGNWVPNGGDSFNSDYDGVISASATHYSKNWFSTPSGESASLVKDKKSLLKSFIANDQIEGNDNLLESNNESDLDALIVALNKKWRPQASYVYKTDVKNGVAKIYNKGTLSDFEMFPWDASTRKQDANGNLLSEGTNDKWLLASEITAYSPNGQPIEETNLARIPSCAKYGYIGNALPTMIAQNAEYQTIFFRDFESQPLSNSIVGNAHSGKKCLDLKNSTNYKLISNNDGVVMNKHLLNKGASVKLWLKSSLASNPSSADIKTKPSLDINDGTINVDLDKIASAGEWGLYEAKIRDWSGIADKQSISVKLNYSFSTDKEIVYVDDFRFQPLDAAATCSVYDIKSFKLLAQFDDQHFGVFYQYDLEGNLIRKMVETERGIKTIQENESNIPKETRK